MSEHLSTKLTAEEEASRIVVAEIKAYPQGGDKREEHLRLFGELLPRTEIEALWAERYAEIARIEKAAKPATVFRRYTSTNAHAPSFILPATQPAADEDAKGTARKATVAKFIEAAKPKKEEAQGEWPDAPTPPANATALERLTYPAGLLGHVVEYIRATAALPDRFMALAGALSALGKCLDRKVLGPTGNSTILFILLIAETGSGKQHIINCIRIILRAAGMEEAIVASGIASMQAVEQILEGKGENIPPQPSPLVVIDEYGSFLTRISTKGQTGNVSEIPATLQTLWGWPPELKWMGSIKVAKEMVKVLGPAFAIFGSSTERAFFFALKQRQVAGGFVNRHMLINAGRGAARRIEPEYPWTQCPNWLVKALQKVSGERAPLMGMPLELRGEKGPTMLRDFRRIGWGPGAYDLWKKFDDDIRDLPTEERELWIRAPEIAERLATIVAVFRGSTLSEWQTSNGQSRSPAIALTNSRRA
jgi:hypothetical protein